MNNLEIHFSDSNTKNSTWCIVSGIYKILSIYLIHNAMLN